MDWFRAVVVIFVLAPIVVFVSVVGSFVEAAGWLLDKLTDWMDKK